MTSTIITQNASNVKEIPCVKICREKKTVEGFAAAEILTGSNELANDILAVSGFTLIRKDCSVRIDLVESFYDVSASYFDGIIKRYFLTVHDAPNDVFARELCGGTKRIFVSARLALALCMIMQQGRNIPKDSPAMKVYENLTKTRYYTRALELVDEEKERAKKHDKALDEAISMVRKGILNEDDLPEITPDGKILITVGGLAKLIGMMNIDTSHPHDLFKTKEISLKNEKNQAEIPQKSEKENKHRRGKSSIPVIATKDGVSTRYESMAACGKAIHANSGEISRAAQLPNYHVRGFSITYA